jgi:hypothetical protein
MVSSQVQEPFSSLGMVVGIVFVPSPYVVPYLSSLKRSLALENSVSPVMPMPCLAGVWEEICRPFSALE